MSSNSNVLSRIELASGKTDVVSCTFYKLNNPSLSGGAIFANNANIESHISYCLFEGCTASTGGGICLNSIFKLDIDKICAKCCNNKSGYGFFADLLTSSYTTAKLISAHYNKGYAATIRFGGSTQTLSNINSTHNSGYQEAGFITAQASFSETKFAHISSNTVSCIGMNFYSGQKYNASYVHYENCTINNNAVKQHVYAHGCYISAYFSHFYIRANDKHYIIQAHQSNNVNVADSYFPSSRNLIEVTTCQNIQFTEVKTIRMQMYASHICETAKFIYHTTPIRYTITNKDLFITIAITLISR